MTHYERLGIDPGASTEEVERAFRKVARQVHPDLNSGDPAVAEARMKELNEIRDILSDPSLRAAYDESLRGPVVQPAPTPPPPPPPTDRRGVTLVVAACGAVAAALLFRDPDPISRVSEGGPAPSIAADAAVAPLLAVPTTRRSPEPARPSRGKVRRRGAVKLGSSADEVFAAFGAPDRIDNGPRSGDATLHYGSLTLEMKNGRVTGGDAAK